jgi:nitrate/nitrite-specific signal transduction histidine kinase
MKIKHKLGVTSLGLSLIIIVMFLATWWMTGKQKDDGLIINLAGRQRMLTQKMTKEVLLFQMQKESAGQSNPALIKGVRNTMEVFEKTLAALKDSGEAPLSLYPVGESQQNVAGIFKAYGGCFEQPGRCR